HRMRLQTSSVLSPVARKEYLLAATRAPLDNNGKAEAYYGLLALDTVIVSEAGRAGYARQLVTVALPGGRLEREYRRWVAARDTARDTLRGPSQDGDRLLLDAAEKLGLWDDAIGRATALAEGDTSASHVKPLQLKIAQYHYNAG